MLLGKYFDFKCGDTKTYGLNSIEITMFRLIDASKGWYKRCKNTEVPDDLIAAVCDKVIKAGKGKPKVLARLKSLRDSLVLTDIDYKASTFGREYLYIMQNELGMYKVGISKNPTQRRSSLSTGSGLEVQLIAYYIGIELAKDVEQMIFVKLKEHLKLGEWFKVNTVTVEMIEALLPPSYMKQ